MASINRRASWFSFNQDLYLCHIIHFMLFLYYVSNMVLCHISLLYDGQICPSKVLNYQLPKMVTLCPQTHIAHILKDKGVHLLLKIDYFPLMFLTKYLLPVTSLSKGFFSFQYVCRLLLSLLSSLFGSHSLLALNHPLGYRFLSHY